MTIKEIAKLCGVNETTIQRWINSDDFLNCKMQLRNQIKEKLEKGSPEKPSDYDLEETLAIIRDGGKNETLASLLAESAANKNALTVHGGNVQADVTARIDLLEKMALPLIQEMAKRLEDPRKAAYEELERWLEKTVEYEDRVIYRVFIRELYHAYKKEVNNPISEHVFRHKIALDHSEYDLRLSKKCGWYFAKCRPIRII